MKIAFNPSTVEALITPPNNKDITFDLRGHNIFARGVKFCGTDTNTWRDIKINNVSIDSNTLDLRDGDNTTLTNINGVVTINSTWRPVVDNLTSDSTTSSLSANLGRVLKALIDGKSDTGHTHDDRYLKLTGGTLTGDLYINTNLYGPAVGNNPRNKYDSGLYFFNCNSSTTSTYNFGLYLWDNEFQFTYRTSADNLFKGNSFTIQGSDGQVTFTKTPKVGSTLVSLNGHTHAYLPLSGGIMTGTIYRNSGGATISGRDHAIIRLTYAPGGSSWNPIACVDTETGTWTLGHLSSGDSDTNFHFCFSTNADYNAGNNNGNYVTLRNKVGTIALLSDIPSSLKNPYALTISLNGTSQGPYDGSAAKNINITPSSIGAATSGHNHDSSYVKYAKVTKSTSDSANANPYIYNIENEAVISGYYNYWYILNFGQYSGGNFGTLIAMPYQDTLADSELFIRSANNGSWRTWRRILHSNNYASILDSRYYTESEVNSLLSNYYPITGGNMSGDNRWIGSTMGGGSDYWRIGGSGSDDTGTCIITVGDNYDDKFAVEIADWQGSISRPLEAIYTGINTLNIYANGTYRLLYSNSANGSTIHSILNYSSSPYGLLTRIYNDGCVSLQSQRESSNSEVFSLSLNPLGGNVGIGTTSPAMKLHVNGDGIYLNSTATCGINMYSSHSESSISYKSSDGIRTVLGTYTNRTFLWNESIGEHVSILSNNGYFGIGTSNPYYKLDVNGDIWCRGALRVGSSATNNYIAFYGNTGDAPGSFVTSFIGEHLWGGDESTELLLMKFNDVGNGISGTTVSGPGPDRIRHIAHAHVFLIMTDTSLGDFATMAATTAVETKFDIARYQLHAYAPLAIISDSTNSGYDGLVYMRHYSNNDWGLIVDKSQSYTYGVDIRAGGEYALKVGNGNTRLIGATIIGADTSPSYTLDVRGTTRSTNRIYANEWIQFDNWTGLYSPNNNAHFYPNDTTSYGQWQLRGNRNGYSGIHFGDSTYYMTVMDSGTHKGLYSLGWGDWILYFNLDNKRLGLRTSSLTGYAVTCSGDFYCRSGWLRTEGDTGWYNESYGGGWYMSDTSWMRSYNGKGVVAGGFYHNSYGSSEYFLTSDGGARYWSNLYDGRYLRYEGWWNNESGQNINDSLGMNFTYTSHGAPHHWGTTVTFEYERGSSYRLQLHGTGDNYLYFRNRSTDYGGWHSSGWKQILTNLDTYVASDGTNRGIINGAEVASARHLLINGTTWNSNWYWSGLSGQPSWLWGSNDGTNMYVWDPNNFNVHTALYLRSLGNLNCQTGRTLNYGDVYSYNTIYSNTGAPTDYTSVIGFGRGIGGTVEIAGGWCNTGLYWRSLRDCCEDWYSWRTVLDSSNYTGYVDNYYWANVKISTSSSTTTSPTVSNLTATNSIKMGNISLEHTDEINNSDNGSIYLNYRNSGNVSLCQGGGNVGIGTTSPAYKLDVNGLMRASGFHHGSVNSDNYILLAGGGYKPYGGNYDNPIFLGYLNLERGNDGTISSSFYCLGYSVSFTYTRGGNYCKIYIPDTSYQAFYIRAAIASVNYSGGGMDTWPGYRRGDGAWWLHCYAYSSNEVRVKGFRQANDSNDSWWGGNPLIPDNGGANRITVCIFGYVTFR